MARPSLSKTQYVPILIAGCLGIGSALWLTTPIEHTTQRSTSDAPHRTQEQNPVLPLYTPDVQLLNLRERMSDDPTAMVHCHAEAHAIGHEAYQTLGQHALHFADPMCGGGYLHGVIEQAFLDNGMDFLSASLHDTCTDDNMESCLHGVGHGLHTFLGNVPDALAACNQINTTHTDCYDGVFMDSFDHEGMPTETTLSPGEARDICSTSAEAEQPSCYFYLPRTVPHADYQSIIDLCTSPDIGSGWAACAEGSGVYFMKSVSGFNKELSVQYCALYTDVNMETLCVNGVDRYEQYGGLENSRWH